MSRWARLAALRLGLLKMSSFLGFRRDDVVDFEGLLETEVLMREESWEVKERVVEEEISFPLVRLCARGW